MEASVITLCYDLAWQACGLEKAEYEIVRNSILKNLLAHGAVTPSQLGLLVKNHLKCKSYGSLFRYYEVVRQDLEARGEIRHVPGYRSLLIEIAG